jgi:hypothetical protein
MIEAGASYGRSIPPPGRRGGGGTAGIGAFGSEFG